MKILFLSSHAPTPAQLATASAAGFTVEHVVADASQYAALLRERGVTPGLPSWGVWDAASTATDCTLPEQDAWRRSAVIAVAPRPVLFALYAQGYAIGEFTNHSSARSAGKFVCSGLRFDYLSFTAWDGGALNAHTVQFECPLSPEEQTAAPLVPTSR